MKSSQSNFNLRSPNSYSACSYLIATVPRYYLNDLRTGEQDFLIRKLLQNDGIWYVVNYPTLEELFKLSSTLEME